MASEIPFSMVRILTANQVYLSYWIQSILALLGFLLLQIYSSWYHYLSLIFSWLRGSKDAYRQRMNFRERPNKHRATLLSVLVDFQKAQCFFMLAMQIAAHVVLSNGLFEGISLQQIYNNYELLGSIAISGFLPITFTLLCLHSAGMRSWYLLILSTITVIISAFTIRSSRMFDPKKASITSQPTFSECGDTNPGEKCLSSRYPDQSNGWISSYSKTNTTGRTAGYSMLVFSLVTLVLLSADLLQTQILRFYHCILSVVSKGSFIRRIQGVKRFNDRLSKRNRFYHLNIERLVHRGNL